MFLEGSVLTGRVLLRLPPALNLLLTLELSLKLWRTMLLLPSASLMVPKGRELRAPDTQTQCVKALWICSSGKGRKLAVISCCRLTRKPPMPTLRGAPGPLPLLSPSLAASRQTRLHGPLQDSGLLPTWSCDIIDGDYQYPPDLGKEKEEEEATGTQRSCFWPLPNQFSLNGRRSSGRRSR